MRCEQGEEETNGWFLPFSELKYPKTFLYLRSVLLIIIECLSLSDMTTNCFVSCLPKCQVSTPDIGFQHWLMRQSHASTPVEFTDFHTHCCCKSRIGNIVTYLNISCCLSVFRIRPTTILTVLEKRICTRRKHLLFLWWKFSSMLSKQSWLCYAFKITCHLVRFHSLIYSLRSSSASSMNKPEKKGQDKLYSLLPYHHYTRRFYFMRMENCLRKSERLILGCR